MKAFTHTIAATALLVSGVSAQYAIDPNSVDNSTRQYWCQQQQTECPLICLQTPAGSDETLSNTCDWSSLTFSCVCSNGLSPNVSEYSQTLPYFICTEWGQQCQSNCNGDNTCASACTQDHPCGASNPTRQNTSTLTSTMSQTGSATGTGPGAGATIDSDGQTIYTGYGDGGASETGGVSAGAVDAEGGASTALSAGQTFGTMFVFGFMTLSFAVLL